MQYLVYELCLIYVVVFFLVLAAPIIISPGQNSTTGGRLPPDGDQNCKIKVPEEGTTIEVSNCNTL